MDKKVLNEINSIKKMMGIINESTYPDFNMNNIPKSCSENEECYFYYDGKVYKKTRKGVVMDVSTSDLKHHLETLGVLGLENTAALGKSQKPGRSTTQVLVDDLIDYILFNKVTSNFKTYFPYYDTVEKAISGLIIPWKPNAKIAIHGAPLLRYGDDTTYLEYGPDDKIDSPRNITNVTDPSVPDEE